MKARLPGFLLILFLLGAWEIGSIERWIDPVEMPPVSTIFLSWYHNIAGGPLLKQVLPSLGRIFAGFFLATALAVPLGLMMGTVQFV